MQNSSERYPAAVSGYPCPFSGSPGNESLNLGVALAVVGGPENRAFSFDLITRMAARVVDLRSESREQAMRGYHRRYFQDAARTDEEQLRSYANLLLAGHYQSRLVARFEPA